MPVLEIRMMGDPVLRERAAEVEGVDDALRRLARSMFETMYDAEGVGLAAPQVGEGRRLIVVDARDPGSAPFTLVNPRVVEASNLTEKAEEGCLSIPGLRDVVERSASVVVEGLDLEERPFRVEAEGLLARILLHEIDHLDGVLFLDRLSPLKRRMLLKRWQKSRHTATTGGL
jgi:peptide deformylase